MTSRGHATGVHSGVRDLEMSTLTEHVAFLRLRFSDQAIKVPTRAETDHAISSVRQGSTRERVFVRRAAMATLAQRGSDRDVYGYFEASHSWSISCW